MKLKFLLFLSILILSAFKASAIDLYVGDTRTLDIGYVSHLKGCQWTISRTDCVQFVTSPSSYSTSVAIKAVKAFSGAPCAVQCTYYYYELDPITGKYTYLRSGYKSWNIFVSDNNSGEGNSGGGNSGGGNTETVFIDINTNSVTCRLGNWSEDIFPTGFSSLNMSYSIDNPEIADIVPVETFDGTNTYKKVKVYGKKSGTTYLHISGKDGSSATCRIDVQPLQDGDNFYAYQNNGLEETVLCYKVISEKNKQCSLKGSTHQYFLPAATLALPSNLVLLGSVIGYEVIEIGEKAFSHAKIESIKIPTSIVTIEDFAFTSCSQLTSIEIPNSVTSIGDRAFYDCSNLTLAKIGDSVTSIGSEAFKGCSNLESLQIGNSVASIGSFAFYACDALTTVEIPNSVTSLGNSAFRDCGNLTSVKMGNSVTSIGEDAFFGCGALNSINMPNSVVYIGNRAFWSCESLTSVEIPNSVISIGWEAFYECSHLASVSIGNSVTAIDENAFFNCRALMKIECKPLTPPSIFKNTFDRSTLASATLEVPAQSRASYATDENWGKFVNIVSDGVVHTPVESITISQKSTNMEVGETLQLSAYITPSDADDKTVTWKCEDPAVATVSDNGLVTAIGEGTTKIIASTTNNLTAICVITVKKKAAGSINLNTNSASCKIGNWSEVIKAVESSKESMSWTIDDPGIADIEPVETMDGSNAYNAVRIYGKKRGTTTLRVSGEDGSFATCLIEILPLQDGDSFYINHYKGSDYLTLMYEVISEAGKKCRVKSIEKKSYLQNLTLLNNVFGYEVVEIGSYAFSGYDELTSVEIPNSVTSIGSGAFWECGSLISVKMGNSVISIGDNAFSGCVELTSVEIPNSVTSIGAWAFSQCSGLTLVKIGNSVASIGSFAFYACDALTSVEIPNSVTSLGNSAFCGCGNLTSVKIGNSVTSIGENIFFWCNSLRKIECMAVIPPVIKENTFDESILASAILEVPAQSQASYATDENWGKFANIVSDGVVHTPVESIDDESDARFAVSSSKFSIGSTDDLAVEMINQSEIIAFQCDVYLPDGVEFAKDDEGDCDIRYAGREGRSHVIMSRHQADNSMRVVGYSTTNVAYKGKDGALFYIPLTLPSVSGDYEVRLSNIRVTDKFLKEKQVPDVIGIIHVTNSLIGDANSDGRITISDAAVTSAYILGDIADDFNFENADVVPDGAITLSDVSGIVNLVLGTKASSPKNVLRRSHGVERPIRDGDLLSVEDIEISPGEEKEVVVSFSNKEPFTSFYTEIILPTGMHFVEEDGEYFIDLATSRKTKSHISACKLQEDGRLRVMAYSSTNALFKGNEGELFTFYVVADRDFDNMRPSTIRMENSYVCNRNEEGKFTDYDISNCECSVNGSGSSISSVEISGWNVYVTESNVLNIVSPDATSISIVSIDGLERTVEVEVGHNRISNLASGFYIVKGKKIIIR